MSRKHKFITTLMSSLVLLSLLIVGVYSLVVRKVSISGQITFVGKQVEATVVVKATEVKNTGHTFIAGDYAQISDKTGKKEFEIGQDQDSIEFGLGGINFNDFQTAYSFRIEITSNMQGSALLQVEYSNNITNLPTTYIDRVESLSIDGVNIPDKTWGNMSAGQTAVWTVIFRVKDPAITPNIPLAQYINESFTIKRV